MSEKIDDIVAKLLEGVETEEFLEFELPSKGRGYTEDLSKVKLRSITYADEKVASQMSVSDSKFNHLDFLLKRAMTDDIDLDDLFCFDKLFLTFKLRQITYGSEMKSTVECPSCDQESVIAVNFNNIPVQYVPDDFEDPYKVILPKSKKECLLNLPRAKHEKYMKSTNSITSNLWRFIFSFEGVENREVISKVLDKLPLIDINYILSKLTKTYGIDTRVKFICAGCGHNENTEIPFNFDFFTES
jgi:hypothetical protein